MGYNETSKACRDYIPSQRKVVVSRDAKFDKDEWSSKSQGPPVVTKEVEELVAPKADLQKSEKSDSDQQASKGARVPLYHPVQ